MAVIAIKDGWRRLSLVVLSEYMVFSKSLDKRSKLIPGHVTLSETKGLYHSEGTLRSAQSDINWTLRKP